MENQNELTKKQKEILTFIKKFIVNHGYAPSVREICSGVGLSSTATVFVHLKNLEKKGVIRQDKNKFRTMEILVDNEFADKGEEVVNVPLLGKVTAGNPIEAIANPTEFFSLPASMIPKHEEIFTLNVWGESMINAGIFDGDIVVVKKSTTARNGQIVVAMNDNNEVTLKRFYKENGYVRLQPENDTMDPIILPTCTIIGIAIGLYREL